MPQTVLILGASSDIAKCISIEFAKKGYNLILTAREMARIESIKQDLNKYDIQYSFYQVDLLDFNSHEEFLNSLPIIPDIFVSAVGYYENQEEARNDFRETYKTVAVNYLGLMGIINRLSLKFEERKSGQIVVISSVAGIRGRQLNYIYGSAKAGITTYLSGLRNKLYKKNISVLTILLGPVYTRMSEGHRLMPYITLTKEKAAAKIVQAVIDTKDVVYIHWIWRYIMLLIQCIPEFIFKRLPPF
jgi:short-subunit dehydrogenase